MSRACCLVAFAILALLPAATPLAAQTEPLVLYAIEGTLLKGSLPIELAGKNVAVKLSSEPAFGTFEVDADSWPNFTYKPAPGNFGRDYVEIETISDDVFESHALEIEVLPRKQLLFGRWPAQDDVKPGLYDTLTRRFAFCPAVTAIEDEDGTAHLELICSFEKVDGVPTGAIALVLPSADGGADRLALYHPVFRVLYHLQTRGSRWVVSEWQALPQLGERYPVAGDWDGDGRSNLAFVGRQGEVSVLEEDGSWSAWAATLQLWPADRATWPIRWPLGDRDALAMVESTLGDALITTPEGFLGYDSCFRCGTGDGLDARRPHSTLHGPERSRWWLLYVLVGDPSNLRLESYFHDDPLLPGEPSTMPVKFPSDPAG